MKVKFVYILLLLFLSLRSLTAIAQLADNEVDARNDRDKAHKKWADAASVDAAAYIDYNESNKVGNYLQSVKDNIDNVSSIIMWYKENSFVVIR